MSRHNLYLVLAFIFIALIWFLAFFPVEQAKVVESDRTVEEVISRSQPEPVETEKMTEVAPLVKVLKPTEALKPVKTESDFFGAFQKKFKNEAYIKVIGNVALTSGDQIAGFIDENSGYDLNKIYKSRVKKSSLWPDGVVPYGFSEGFPPGLRERVLIAIEYFNYEAPVRFVEFDENSDEDAIAFTYNENVPCSSYVGRVGGLQQLFLNFKCSEQSVLHELMHSLGFVHEQQLPFRDEFISISWKNIEKEALHNFTKAPEAWTKLYEKFDDDFDYTSIMMYDSYAFATPGKESMSSKTDKKIAPIKKGLSDIDLERLRALY